MSQLLLASKSYLTKKFSINSEYQLYLHLSRRYNYPQYNIKELIHFINFLTLSNQRKILGDAAKFRVIELLNENNTLQISMSLDQSISLLIGLSNLLIYDQMLIQQICDMIDSNLQSISIKDKLQIARCLIKLKLESNPLFQKITDKLINQFLFLDSYDQLVFLLMQSELYSNKFIQQEQIQHLLNKFIDQNNYNIQNYMAQVNHRYCQMMFNLYPEIINQNYQIAQSLNHNPFNQYFLKLERNYKVARKLIDINIGLQKVDYFEYPHLNFLNIPFDENQGRQTSLEKSVHEVLQKLNIKFETQQRIMIYDVDFVLSNKMIINCNGPLHFIQNLKQEIIDFSPNHNAVLRHLQQGLYQVVEINFGSWNNQSSLITKQTHLQKLINLY